MRDNQSRAKTAQKLIKIYSTSMLLSLISGYLTYKAYSDLSNFSFSMNGINTSNFQNVIKENLAYTEITQIISLVSLGLFIATSVVFIQWFRRSYFNLHTTGVIKPKYSEGMAAGSWWIPFANLVIPYQIFKELWTGFSVLAEEKPKTSSNITTMWSLWVTGWVLLLVNVTYISIKIFSAIFEGIRLGFQSPENVKLFLTNYIEMMNEVYFFAFLGNIIITVMFVLAGFLLAGIIKKISALETSANVNNSVINELGKDMEPA